MKTGTTIAALALLAITILGASAAAAGEVVGVFTLVEGGVDILRQSDVQAVPVRPGDAVGMGDAVRTKRNGRAEIRFRDETAIQLAPETRITIDEYTFRGADQRERGLLSLLRGKVRAIVSKLRATAVPVTKADAGFNIRTPTAIAGVKGTTFIVYYERGVTGVIFIDGDGFVYNPNKPDRVVSIRGGQASFVLDGEEPPLDARPVSDPFVAPYLRDFPGTTPTIEGAAGPGVETAVNIVMSNTTYPALVDTFIGAGGDVTMPLSGGPLIVGDVLSVSPGPPGGTTTIVPITEVNPALLPTPVTIQITVP